MNTIQEKILNMFKRIIGILEENKLPYYIIGGTMLGAVRHKGFIPWDDDIDIAMPRDSYNRLIKLSDKILPNDIELKCKEKDKSFKYNIIKIYDTNTTLIENKIFEVGGIYIDIFALDGCKGNTIKEAIESYRKLKRWKALFYISVLKYKSKNSIKSIIKKAISLINNNVFYNIITKKLSRYTFENSKYVMNALGAWDEKEIMPKEYFGKPTKYTFEGVECYGVEKYDDYLKNLYGDYMKLPPIEKQKSHHNILYLNLDLPYEQYKEKINE